MKRYWYIFVIGVLMLMQTSCTTSSNLTRGEVYAKLYKEKPVSILVMPPINNTSNVEAKDLLYTSVSRNIAEAGYYVISPLIAMDVLRNESAYDAEYFINSSLGKFKEYFGVDAVIFATIENWAKEGWIIHTKVNYMMKSTTTNEILFERSCDLHLDLMKNSGTGGLLGVFVDAIATAVDVAMTEHIEAARYANHYVFDDLPYGKYSPLYMLDKEVPAKDKHVKKALSR